MKFCVEQPSLFSLLFILVANFFRNFVKTKIDKYFFMQNISSNQKNRLFLIYHERKDSFSNIVFIFHHQNSQTGRKSFLIILTLNELHHTYQRLSIYFHDAKPC